MEHVETILEPCTGEAMPLASPGANLHLMRGSLLARNVIWNLIGNSAPMLSWLKYAAAGYLYFSTATRRPSATVQGGAAQRLNPTLER
jgi:hypothetical protein